MNTLMKSESASLRGSVVRSLVVAGLCLLFSLGSSSTALAGGSVEAGAEKSVACAACHGEAGISNSPVWPILAGQYETYIVQALKSYRSGTRENAIMAGFASALSDEDIADLAAYFAAQDGPLRTAPRN